MLAVHYCCLSGIFLRGYCLVAAVTVALPAAATDRHRGKSEYIVAGLNHFYHYDICFVVLNATLITFSFMFVTTHQFLVHVSVFSIQIRSKNIFIKQRGL